MPVAMGLAGHGSDAHGVLNWNCISELLLIVGNRLSSSRWNAP